jgi:hypothetical protein
VWLVSTVNETWSLSQITKAKLRTTSPKHPISFFYDKTRGLKHNWVHICDAAEGDPATTKNSCIKRAHQQDIGTGQCQRTPHELWFKKMWSDVLLQTGLHLRKGGVGYHETFKLGQKTILS